MEVQDAKFEIFIISVAAGNSLEQSDFAIHHLDFACTNWVFIPVQYKRLPCFELSRSIYQYGNSARRGLIDPKTGGFLPDVGRGYIDPSTGRFIPKQ